MRPPFSHYAYPGSLKKNSGNRERTPLYTALLVVLGFIIFFLILLAKTRVASDISSDAFLFSYAVFVTTFHLSRLVSVMFYKRSLQGIMEEIPPAKLKNYEPTISFVIPCKNEEGAIQKTVEQCFAADYPAHKIEVIVINDGSTDRTGEILEAIHPSYDGLHVIDWKINRGKRHAMAAGFRRAQGEIIIQLDSDSYIDPATLRDFILPFANPSVGAVCAHADPENADANWITKMQAAYYFMSFRILKAAESTYGTVFCCSGCSSAFRRDIVLPVIDVWLHERFLGLPVTWGDDRGLTNYVLRKGYKTIYTDSARAYTIVPETLRQFIKQQIRWKKGWFVNSVFASRFIVKRDIFVSFAYFFPLFLVTLLTPFMAIRALFYTPVTTGFGTSIFYGVGIALIASLIVIFYRYAARNNKYWPHIFVWAGLNMILLSFLLVYALITIQDRRWGTR